MSCIVSLLGGQVGARLASRVFAVAGATVPRDSEDLRRAGETAREFLGCRTQGDVDAWVAHAEQRAQEILTARLPAFKALSLELYRHGRLTEGEIAAIVDGAGL